MRPISGISDRTPFVYITDANGNRIGEGFLTPAGRAVFLPNESTPDFGRLTNMTSIATPSTLDAMWIQVLKIHTYLDNLDYSLKRAGIFSNTR